MRDVAGDIIQWLETSHAFDNWTRAGIDGALLYCRGEIARALLEQDAAARREGFEEAIEASAWRPISEVQPRDVVLVWDNGTLSRDPGVKVWRAGSQKITTPGITHWMPLPTPPEGGE